MHPMFNSKPRLAVALGVAGLLPFAACLVMVAYSPEAAASNAQRMLASYAAIILSFLGGVQWGGQIKSNDFQPQALALSIVPALIAWSAAIMGSGWAAMLLLAFAFAGTLWLDRLSDWPRWFQRLRLGLTLAVFACLMTAAIVLIRS